MKEMGRHVEVVLKALDLLDCFQSQAVFSIKDFVRQIQITRSRALRLLGTLEYRGYLTYDLEQRTFQLGPKLFTLGKIFETNHSLIALARPIVKDMVQRTGECASLYVMDGLERVALVREKGTHEISYSVTEGQRMELHAGAAGKVLLAFGPHEVRTRLLSKGTLKKLTPGTITDPGRLARELETIRRRKYAFSLGERVLDVWSVAAPVFDHEGKVCSAIGITGPVYRTPKRMQSKYMEVVIQKSHELSRRLGWQGPVDAGKKCPGTMGIRCKSRS